MNNDLLETFVELRWWANCEFCPWSVQTDDRQQAVTKGHQHIADAHPNEEWSFRVRGYRPHLR